MFYFRRWTSKELFENECILCVPRPNSQDAKNVNLGENGAKIAKKVVDDQYIALGPMTWHEIVSTISIAYVLKIETVQTSWCQSSPLLL